MDTERLSQFMATGPIWPALGLIFGVGLLDAWLMLEALYRTHLIARPVDYRKAFLKTYAGITAFKLIAFILIRRGAP